MKSPDFSLIFSKKVDFPWHSLILKRDFEIPWFSLILRDAGHPVIWSWSALQFCQFPVANRAETATRHIYMPWPFIWLHTPGIILAGAMGAMAPRFSKWPHFFWPGAAMAPTSWKCLGEGHLVTFLYVFFMVFKILVYFTISPFLYYKANQG